MKTLTFLLATVIELYTMIMLLRVWMQWARCDFYNPFSQFIVKVTQPVVGPLRRIIPAMGPIDSSSLLIAFILCVVKAIVLFMVVKAMNRMKAAAEPAVEASPEVPADVALLGEIRDLLKTKQG